eukprot:SAG31_NODE_21866_length_539_cov_0.675000_1_plen_100_part_01
MRSTTSTGLESVAAVRAAALPPNACGGLGWTNGALVRAWFFCRRASSACSCAAVFHGWLKRSPSDSSESDPDPDPDLHAAAPAAGRFSEDIMRHSLTAAV